VSRAPLVLGLTLLILAFEDLSARRIGLALIGAAIAAEEALEWPPRSME
jgi:hypothetical protein